MKQISIAFDNQTKKRLAVGAQKRDVSIADQVRYLLTLAFALEEGRADSYEQKFTQALLEKSVGMNAEMLALIKMVISKSYADDPAARDAILEKAKTKGPALLAEIMGE